MFKRNKKDEITYRTRFTYKDLTAMEEFLEEKQREGLQLVKYDSGIMTFEKCEPSDSRYSCEIFVDGDLFYPNKEFVQMCESGGWKYIADDDKGLYVFKTDDENVTDIMTDDKTKLSIIAKSHVLKSVGVAVGVIIYYVIKYCLDINEFFETWSNPVLISSRLTTIIMILLCAIYLIYQLSWLIKRKIELNNGEKLKFNNLRSFQNKWATIPTILLLWIAVETVFSIFICGEFDISVYVDLGAYAVLFIIFSCVLFKRRSDTDKIVKVAEITTMAVSVVAIALSFLISFVALPPVPNETDLSEKIVSELDIDDEDKEVYVSRTRFAQYYDNGWDFEMFVSRNSKLKDKYFSYMIDYYSDTDPKYTVSKNQLDDMIYYEFTNTEENYTYKLLAVKDDRVIAVGSPQENTAQIIYDALTSK
ncbi:MAG: DUF2812 domain-containing protein [Faecalibacterium sp.]|nr:DUF2812 domain-containing protein [Ruminococcus sp.]MCM1393243.1 DUF2812 domain-containing protein [Ruminococcus sp.]MCM1486466.1 DUF2812 domain-containing protein [Faecalibacterium sp.]